MFDRYTETARRVIFFSRYEASQFGSPYIETEHLLLGLLRENKSLVNQVLRDRPSVIDEIRKKIESSTLVREKVSTSVDLPLSNESRRILAYAAEESERAGHQHVGTEHLLAGMMREKDCFAATLLTEAGLSLDGVRVQIKAGHRPPLPVESLPAGTLAEHARLGQADGCMEIVWGSVRVGISGLAATTHIPREGDEVIINDAGLGLRSFRVKDVTYYYETEPPAVGAPQRLSKVIVRVEKSGAAGENALYDST